MVMMMIASIPNNDGRKANNAKEGNISISVNTASISGNDTHNLAKEDANLLDSFWTNSVHARWSVVGGIVRECIREEASGIT